MSEWRCVRSGWLSIDHLDRKTGRKQTSHSTNIPCLDARKLERRVLKQCGKWALLALPHEVRAAVETRMKERLAGGQQSRGRQERMAHIFRQTSRSRSLVRQYEKSLKWAAAVAAESIAEDGRAGDGEEQERKEGWRGASSASGGSDESHVGSPVTS